MKIVDIQDIKDIVRTLFEVEMLFSKYKIGNDIISIKDLKLLSIEGHEYVVFLYNDKVVKIHRKHLQRIYALNEENVLSLIGIPTKRILMPTDALYNIDGNIEGYLMQPVFDEKDIYIESMGHFFNEISGINNDVQVLNDNNILLCDIHPGNAIYNGSLYLIDSGRYKKVSTQNCELKDKNGNEINTFLCKYIMKCILSKYDCSTRIMYLNKIKAYLQDKSNLMGTKNYIDVIESEVDIDMTVYEYSHSLIKKIK